MSSQHQVYRSQSLDLTTPPITPPNESSEKLIHPWPEPELGPEEEFPSAKRRKTIENKPRKIEVFNASHQDVLLLHAQKQKYAHTREQPIPSVENDREMLVKVDVVGLNPIDWKAPYV